MSKKNKTTTYTPDLDDVFERIMVALIKWYKMEAKRKKIMETFNLKKW